MKFQPPSLRGLPILILFPALLVTFGALPSATAETDKGQDWPMWGYDAARSGQSPADVPEKLHLQWSRQLASPERAWPAQLDDGDKLEFDLSYSPVVMGKKIFVPSMTADSLTAYRIDDGTEIWRHYADGPVRLAPAAWKDKVFFVSDDGHLYCVDAETGKRLWRFRAAPSDRLVLGNNRLVSMWAARGGPVVKDGTVYFAAGVWPFMGTFVYALDAESGEVVWQNTGDSTNWQAQPHGGAFSFAGIAPQGYLAATEDRLVVSGGRAPAALLDRHTGELLALDIIGKSVGGYRVQADGTHFYQHGSKYQLSDGAPDGKGELLHKTLEAKRAELAAELGIEIFEILAARGRVFATTLDGRLLCLGPEKVDAPVVHNDTTKATDREGDFAASVRKARLETLVAEGARNGGYALFLGVENGDLLEAVANLTDLRLVGIDPDPEKIERLRRRFDGAGLYGSRIALLAGTAETVKIPPYLFSYIVSANPAALATNSAAIHDLLRPYGGKAFLGDEVVSRDGPLPGAGEWTHQYADAARSAISRDDLVKAPLGVLWYGSESHNNILPRHAIGPRPQISGGRLVILGVESISARDVYTGRELWVRDFPGIGHPFTDLKLEKEWSEGTSVYMTNIPGAAYIGSPCVSLADSIYLRFGGKIHRLDPATGESLDEFALYPEGHKIDPNDWGHLSISGDLIITTTGPHFFDDSKLGWLESWNATSSRHLLVINRFTGERLWEKEAKIGFRHNAIVAGDGRIFVIDGLSEEALKLLGRRGVLPEQKSKVTSLDALTGKPLWSIDSDVFGTYLAFSEEHNILMESGSRDTRRPLSDEPDSKAVARNADTGEFLWEGKMQFPAAIRGETLIPARPGNLLNILTGEPVPQEHPITGEIIPESYTKFYGCSAANASTHLLLFRSGSAGYLDLDQGCGTANLGGFKSGCTSNMIAADGILNAPDYTRTCTCSYQNQTSLGLIHMPEADHWTSVTLEKGKEPVRRLGVNFGAPGNRRAADGTLWVPYPAAGAPAPELDILVSTLGGKETGNRILSAKGSGGENPGSALDGDSSTGWTVTCDKRGSFQQSLTVALEKTQALDRIEVAWAAPKKTEFRIEVSTNGKDWKEIAEETGSGTGRERRSFPFEKRPVKEVRLSFGKHGDTSEDSKGRRAEQKARVSELLLGDLEWPGAYAYFTPKTIARRHPLEVDGSSGLNWVAASAIEGVSEVILSDLRGGDHPYTVTLHFAETGQAEAGERLSDIAVQGKVLARRFDIADAAGGSLRAVTRSFAGIPIGDSVRIELIPVEGTRFPPVISGIEIVRE